MGLKENLLKKMEIDRLSGDVIKSLSPSGGEVRIDREKVIRLLELSPFKHQKRRDLDLYVKEDPPDPPYVLVLDNELALYRTDIDDVVLRKSPVVKEMVSIRNIIKILNDAGVVVCKKEDSVRFIQQECLAGLNLDVTRSELDRIRIDAIASHESRYAEGIKEGIMLFAELLEFVPPPFKTDLHHTMILGDLNQASSEFGPCVVLRLTDTGLLLYDDSFSISDPEKIKEFMRFVKESEGMKGSDVFGYLFDLAVRKCLKAG